uniref:M20/M25/M40 family metallo-hydrolase n=1 Tax=uncultured Exiguobacterium sp. TaxID=202669 RepID=UPI0025ED2A34
MQTQLFEALEQFEPTMIALRRDFHRHPELSFQEVRTPERIANFYAERGIPHETAVGGRGVVATIEGKHPGPTIAVRADFDALPLQEETTLAFRSIHPGVMHACGHDGHTAMVMAGGPRASTRCCIS